MVTRRDGVAIIVVAALVFGAEALLLRGEGSAAEHQNAEAVLFPECVAKQNAWAFGHPISDPKHYGLIDAKDRDRFETARKTCEKFYSEMRRAAY